ncbi:hypothetical protein G9A89_008986 [Geosiphon pyriformis]|nr:hypothetical protein G9A89_008986 [Geosiphon pyriformis]
MFSGAALDKKHLITAIYTEATVNNTPIKLILDSKSAGSIITLQLVNQLGFKVDSAATSQIITANRSTKLSHEFQPLVATSKNPASTKNLPLNLRKIQHYQPSKLISSLGLITKKQDYQPYQRGPVKEDPNGTK